MALKIQVKILPNPNCRMYCVGVRIFSRAPYDFWEALLSKPESIEYLERVGVAGATLVREIMTIVGVYNVGIKPRGLSILKDNAVNWESIEPGVIRALEKVGCDIVRVAVPDIEAAEK